MGAGLQNEPRLDSADDKVGRPRIEAPVIGELQINTMGTGVVWSGKLEYEEDANGNPIIVNSYPIPANESSNDYASIGAARIGCISPEADIWFKDCPLFEVGRFDLGVETLGNMLGELHLPYLRDDEVILIHGRLGDPLSPGCVCVCGIVPVGALCPDGTSTTCWYMGAFSDYWHEASPRGIPSYPGEAENGIAVRAGIFITSPDGLDGQIIIDARRTGADPGVQRPATHVKGFVQVGQAVLEYPAPVSLHQLPLYHAPSSSFTSQPSGGAVGVVPYGQYWADSAPRMLNPTTAGISRFDSFVEGTTPVIVRYYGPLKSADPEYTQWLHVEKYEHSTNTWNDVSGAFVQSLLGASKRYVRLDDADGATISAGLYKTRPMSGRLLCDLVSSALTEAVEVMDTPFLFRFGCALGGNPNPADIATSGAASYFSGPDGEVTGDDFDAFIAGFFEELTYPNGALLADVSDESGNPTPDGLLTGADFDAFIAAFFIGCD